MQTNRAKAFKAIEKRIRRGSSPYPAAPVELLLREVATFEPLFQTRSPSDDESETHIRKLHRAIKCRRGKPLDPVQVFWVGDAWMCIDGHHRLKAYKRAVGAGHWQESQPVPVTVFEGTLLDASAAGGAENGKDRLPMQDREREDHAWSFVILDAEQKVSKKETAEKTGVGTATIGNMRRVLGYFREQKPMHDPADFSWRQAQHLERFGEERESGSAEERRQQDVERYARLLRKAFKDVFTQDASLLVDVVREAYSGEYLPTLSQALTNALSENSEDDGREPAEALTGDF